MPRTELTEDGGITLPEDLMERMGRGPGTELELATQGDTVLLRAVRTRRTVSADEVVGCIPYDGPPVSIEEMDEGVDQLMREKWEDFEKQPR